MESNRIDATSDFIDRLYQGEISLDEAETSFGVSLHDVPNNWYCVVKNGSQSTLAVVTETGISALHEVKYDLKPKNVEQEFLTTALYDRDIAMVTVIGGAGTGKTLVTLAAAVQQVYQEKRYSRLIITKPRTQITDDGEPMGEVPGDMVEKMGPQMLSYEAAIRKAFSKNGLDMWRHMIEKGVVQIIPLEMMRGIDFSNCFVICDEAQNVGRNQFAALATRINESSKLVVMGDIEQVDRKIFESVPMMQYSQHEMYRNSELTTFIELTKVERGPLTKLIVAIHRDLMGFDRT